MVSEQKKRLPERVVYSSTGEEETEVSLLKVRALLSSLPTEACPVGFEQRLNRRLQGMDERPRAAAKSWTSGWAGVGLGFAAAAVIALFAFDFDASKELPQGTIAKSTVEVAPVIPSTQNNDAATQTGLTGGEEPLAVEQNPATTTDSVKRQIDPTYVSPDRLQQVSGAGK